ncbi:MAG: hypothetical protein ACRDOH_11915 [Streptosporangiaceae bacterium]
MTDLPCTIKLLPDTEWEAAASKAIEINPANGLARDALRQANPQAAIDPRGAPWPGSHEPPALPVSSGSTTGGHLR